MSEVSPICEAEDGCERPAGRHLVWPIDPATGLRPMVLSCGAHLGELLDRYATPEFTHDPTIDCALPHSAFDAYENRCVLIPPGLADEVTAFLRHPVSRGAT